MCGSYLGILLFLAAGAMYVVVQTLYVQTTRVHLTVKDLPSLTLIHITDLHGRIRFLNGSLHRLLNRWRPDMVFVTGDLAQNSGQLAYVMDEIARVRVKRGIYFVPGNYEREEMRGVRSLIRDVEVHADLLLTGHTHGGQVRLFGKTFGAYKHFHIGSKKDRQVGLFSISRGLGTSRLPLRLHCFPEITVYLINQQNQSSRA